MENEIVYILSTGRSGTTFLYNFIKQNYPEINIIHQTRWSRLINIVGNLPLKEKYHIPIIKWTIKATNKHRVSTLDPLVSIPLAKLAINTKLNAKIIHLVRDPSKVVQSFMNWRVDSFRKIILHYFIPFWMPIPLFNGIRFTKWIRMSKFEKYCWIWNYKNSIFFSLGRTYDYLLIRIEDIVDPKKEALKNLLEYLDLEDKELSFPVENQKNASKRKKFPNYELWTTTQKSIFQHYCFEQGVIYGY